MTENKVEATKKEEEEEEEEEEKKEEEIVWYFAIGSMCNPISISNRDISTIESHPAEVLDYRLDFFGSTGVAGATAEKGKSFHGVLHKMRLDQKAKLD